MSNNFIATDDQIAAFEQQLTHMKIQHWLREDLFSTTWWFLLAVLIIPWIIWWKLVDKERILKISLFGAMVLIFSSYFDTIGCELAWWQYNRILIPLWYRLISTDFAVMPVTYMFIYQCFRNWRSFIAASTVMSLLYAFVAEPILIKYGIYKINHWSHWYSLVIYIMLAVFLRLLVDKISSHGT